MLSKSFLTQRNPNITNPQSTSSPIPLNTLKANILEARASTLLSDSVKTHSDGFLINQSPQPIYTETEQRATSGPSTFQSCKSSPNKPQKLLCSQCNGCFPTADVKPQASAEFSMLRPSSQVELECLRKRIDELCEDNHILYMDLQDYKHAIGHLLHQHRKLKRSAAGYTKLLKDNAELRESLTKQEVHLTITCFVITVQKKVSDLEGKLTKQRQMSVEALDRISVAIENEIVQSSEEDVSINQH